MELNNILLRNDCGFWFKIRGKMGTKNNPGKFDCYTKAESDEPMFVLLARDHFAPAVVEIWVHMISMHNQAIGEPAMNEKLAEASNVALEMRKWKERKDNPVIEHIEEKTLLEMLRDQFEYTLNEAETHPMVDKYVYHLQTRIADFLKKNTCVCSHLKESHNILQEFGPLIDGKPGPAEKPEFRHCKECKCPKFQKADM